MDWVAIVIAAASVIVAVVSASIAGKARDEARRSADAAEERVTLERGRRHRELTPEVHAERKIQPTHDELGSLRGLEYDCIEVEFKAEFDLTEVVIEVVRVPPSPYYMTLPRLKDLREITDADWEREYERRPAERVSLGQVGRRDTHYLVLENSPEREEWRRGRLKITCWAEGWDEPWEIFVDVFMDLSPPGPV